MKQCYISNHPYDYDAERGGCRCIARYDDYVMPEVPLFGTVPGGANDTQEYRFHMDFDKGLDRYSKARANGLQPNTTTVKGVEEAEAQAASQQRAVDKLKKQGDLPEGVKTVPGVEK